MPPDPSSATAFHDLALIAREGSSGLAGATLKVQTELFIGQARAGDVDGAQFEALALMLLPLVDEAVARQLAEKLAPCAPTPRSVLEALFARGGGVAELVIDRAPQLPASIVDAALVHHDPRLATRLAGRADLSEAGQGRLLDRNESAVTLALASNAAIRLARDAGARLIGLARQHAELVPALFARADIDRSQLIGLYTVASGEQRAAIRHSLAERLGPIAPKRLGRALGEAETENLLERALEGPAPLTEALALACSLDGRFVADALADDSRDILGVALIAAGIQPEDATRMLLRTGDSVAQDSLRLTELVMTMRAMPRAVASAIMAQCWPSSLAGAGQHMPAMAPGGTPSRPGAQSPVRRPWPQIVSDRQRTRG